MSEIEIVASDLLFPEGPIAMLDGSVLLVEMFGPRITRISPDGSHQVVAEVKGGPNGAAIGPDGVLFLCNNGGSYTQTEVEGLCFPGPVDLDTYIGGRIQCVDISSGEVTDLYTACDGRPLHSPNDIVFDGHGGFYFTDHGLTVGTEARFGAIYYARADGSAITNLVPIAYTANGIALSPDDSTLYWAETQTGRVMQRRIAEPGVLEPIGPLDTESCLYSFPEFRLLDPLAVDGDGNVCMSTALGVGGITVISPDGDRIAFVETGDPATTNICFGGADLRTAYITLSGTGRLASMEWPRPGAALHHLNI
jgi:gluconolactonase